MTRIQMGAMRRTGAGRKGQAGFSLTEVAVALSISGLMIGGVLKGVEMMEQGRILKSGALLEQTVIGHQMFIDKYQYMPGDLGTATSLLNANAVDGNSDNIMTATSGAATPALATTATDGLYGEALHYWTHLAAAGMGPGTTGFISKDDTSDTRANATESVIEGSNFPAFPLGGFMQIVSGQTARENGDDSARTLTSVKGDTAGVFPQFRKNELFYRIGHGKEVGSNDLSPSTTPNFTPAISAHDMARMDVKFDDGRPTGGRMMTTTTKCINGSTDLTTMNYDYMSATPSACILFYRAASSGGLTSLD